jgi:excisionase family DNA binding protein
MKIKTNLEQELAVIKQLLTVQTDEPLNIDEACKYLNNSKSYLYKLTCRKEIPYYKPNGKKIYFKKSELDKWLFRNKVNTNEQLDRGAEAFIKEKGL